MAEFDAWADVYDLIHTGLPGEVEFYVGQAVRLGQPVLEIGSGTGRVALAMALSGVDVTGLDNSEAMLEIARDKLEQLGDVPGSARFACDDMRYFAFEDTFGFIAMPYRTWMHLHTPDDQERCLARVRAHLAPGGLFAFNTWNARPSHFATYDGAVRLEARLPLPDDEGALLHYRSATVDELHQRLDEEHIIHELNEYGDVVATRCLSLSRTWSTFREVHHMVQRCGFDIDAVFGDFDCGPVGSGTTEMIWMLR